MPHRRVTKLLRSDSDIRLANKDDLEGIARLGQLFFNETSFKNFTHYDPESVIQFLNALLDSDEGVIVVATIDNEMIGMCAAVLYPIYFNLKDKGAQELFWWVNPEHRGTTGKHMLRLMESEVKRRGAASFTMIALEAVEPVRTGKIYKRQGYETIEHHYIKVI